MILRHERLNEFFLAFIRFLLLFILFVAMITAGKWRENGAMVSDLARY